MPHSIRTGLALVASLGCASVASADENDATTCLGTKVQSEYPEGWSLRTSQSFTLAADEHRVFKVRMLSGNDYRLQACGDDAAADLDIVVYDSEGKELSRDPSDGGAPSVDFKPSGTGAFLVVVHAAQLQTGAASSGVAFGISYR